MSNSTPRAGKCRDESDCDHMPWCRIRGECQSAIPRAALPPPAVKAGDYAGPPGEGASENYWDAEQVEQIRRETVQACADCIPTSWLDSLLTGPDAIAASDTEALLLAVKDRILALLPVKDQS